MKKKLIFDIGMHEGQDTEFYLSKGYDVIAIEANPFLCEKSFIKFKNNIENGSLKIINKGIGEAIDKLKFYINKNNSVWSSFIYEIASRDSDVEEVIVDVITLESLVQEYGVPYYLKIDVEGYDHHVLKGLLNLESKPEYVSVEASVENYPSMINLFCLIGYKSFKIIDQSMIKEVKNKDWVFSYGSSGPFGEETVGKWRGREEILENIKKCYDNIGKYVWYDIHAKWEFKFL